MSDAPDSAPDSAEDHDENSVPGLWDAARWFMRWLVGVCGGPCDVAAMSVLARKERRDVLYWLRPVEALVRRLLVAEAARAAATLPPGRPGRRAAPSPPRRRVAVPDPGNPEQWAVAFPLSGRTEERPGPRRRAGRAGRFRSPAPGRADDEFEYMRRVLERLREKPRPAPMETTAPRPEAPRTGPASPRRPADLSSPWPLARRIEAVRRVLDDRERHVRRLARLLARRRSVDIRRITRACRPPPERPPGSRWRFGETSLRHASAHALAALAAFDTG